MASARYQTIAQGYWPYLGTALKLLNVIADKGLQAII